MCIRIHGCVVETASTIPYIVTLTALVLAMQSTAFGATLICRWVDESGRQHVSDLVPDAFKNIATCTDSRQYAISADQQKEVEKNSPTASGKSSRATAEPPKGSELGTRPPPPPNAKLPVEVVTATTDCQTWWRIYDESSACFGPYRTTRGGVRPEAFDKCNDIPSPELKCGPRRN